VVATLRRASLMSWRISSIKTDGTGLSPSPIGFDLVCLRAIIHCLTSACRFHLHLGTDYEIMGLGRVRTALGCGNPKRSCKHACCVLKIPYAFAVGEPVTYVQAPKAKGHGSRASFGFPTPRSRVYKGSLRGRTADVSPLAQVEELPLIPPETTAHYIPSHTGRLIRVAPMLYAIAQESSSSISNTYRRRRVTGNCVGAIT